MASDAEKIEALHAALDEIRNAHNAACSCFWCITSRRRPCDRPRELIACPKYSYVLESTSTACTNCGDAHGVNIGFWFNAEWTPGTFPDRGRPPKLVVCTACLEAAGVLQLVGPKLAR